MQGKKTGAGEVRDRQRQEESPLGNLKSGTRLGNRSASYPKMAENGICRRVQGSGR